VSDFSIGRGRASPLPAYLRSDKEPIVTIYVLFNTVSQTRQLKHAIARERGEVLALSLRLDGLSVKHSRSLQVTR
jgi:hypothetical protein